MNEPLTFKLANTVTQSERMIVCPACGKSDSSIDHLKGPMETKWYCNSCGVRYALRVAEDGGIQVAVTSERVDKTLVLLRCGKVGLVVEGMKFTPDPNNGDNGDGYFYDEHTCPTNFLRYVIAVIDLETGDPDPHGIFEYVTTLPWESFRERPDEEAFIRANILPHFRAQDAAQWKRNPGDGQA